MESIVLALLEAGSFVAAASFATLVAAGKDSPGAFGQWAVVMPCLLGSLCFNGLYDPRILRDPQQLFPRLARSFAAPLALVLLGYALVPSLGNDGSVCVATLTMGTALAFATRSVHRRARQGDDRGEPIVILGGGQLAERLCDEIEATGAPFRVLGLVREFNGGPAIEEQLLRAVAELGPKRIVVAMAERRSHLPLRALLRLRADGIVVEDGLEFSARLTGEMSIEALTPSSLIFSKDFQKPAWTIAVSRIVSVVFALAALILLAPFLALIAIAIKLDSSGPVLFVHRRLGLRAEPFDLIKFRTMRMQAEKTSEWEGDNRLRITRIGRALRKFRLDELPQFLNVLKGEMNLVGPRPHPVSNHSLFLENIPFYPLRCAIRPGITGWAQIKYGYANNLEEETEKMRFDLYYVKHMSVPLDLRILLDTVRVVVLGRNGRAERRLPTTMVAA